MKSAFRRFMPSALIGTYNRIIWNAQARKLRKGSFERFDIDVRKSGNQCYLTKGERRMIVPWDDGLYLSDLVQAFDYYFDAIEPRFIDGRWVADFATTSMHLIRGISEFHISLPSYTEPLTALEEYVSMGDLKNGETVIDLGAFAGLTSLLFSRAVGPTGKVLSVEADPSTFDCLVQNVGSAVKIGYAYPNIKPLNYAAWSSAGRITFSNESAMGSGVRSVLGPGRGRTVSVSAATLADLCSEEKLERVDLIKMDIEGSELEVLASSRDFLREFRPRLLIEPHLVDSVSTGPKIVQILQETGFETEEFNQYGTEYGVTRPLIVAYARHG